MGTVNITRGNTLPNSSQKADFHNLIDQATGSVSNIVNADIDSGAAIANSKLNLTTITQDVTLSGTNTLSGVTTMSSKIFKEAKGADVASVAGTITLGDDGNFFDITGTNAITSITAKAAGTIVTLQFDSTASLVDGSNLKLNSNFTGATDRTITLRSDGTNWFEVGRSNAGSPDVATQAQMEAASDNTVMVSPSNLKWGPAVAKAWVNFNGSGTPAIRTSLNVTSITDNGTGDFTINFTTSFSTADFAAAGAAYSSGVYATLRGTATSTGFAAGSHRINITDASTTLTDATIITMVYYGDFS